MENKASISNFSSKDVNYKLGYPVYFETDAFLEIEKFIKNYNKFVIITDSNIDKLYKNKLNVDNKKSFKYVIKAGEGSKNISEYYNIIRFLSKNNIYRSDLIVYVGGGVTGDISGFVASTYMRGIDYIAIPTSLLAMVDSSIGSKTGIDTDDGKNLIGTFYAPKAVFIDQKFLDTLSKEEFLNGLGEVIKYAIIKDKKMFELLVSRDVFDKELVLNIIKTSVNIKIDIVESDLKESGNRKLLNFGHTFAHAIEKLSNYNTKHGMAVITGMYLITKSYYKMGLTDEETYKNVVNIIQKYNLVTKCMYTEDELLNVILKDKKNDGDKISLIYPKSIGNAIIDKVDQKNLKYIIQNALKI